ncbi:DUF5672 family protein [Psychroflexus sediminis]|uniref:DUF5672 domain-containing protein n=1 Tax=Psychroflexus sediminis TaxID=470826 RepID=A0A1G7WX14_9FLAO|nr:DUF5672 family protein [Psychroflexus sediminis]SDG76416.1 hypothetical protein SAMN04488027_106186 [Psychroflexus sediminis]
MKQNPESKYVIIVPVYKDKLTHNEKLVFENLFELYNKNQISIICPKHLHLPVQLQSLNTERFDDYFFSSISGYNRLLLSFEFYKRFEAHRFILIHQLDAYLFSDNLAFWCDQNYDYIGAPWLRDESFLAKLFRSKKVKDREAIFNKVGNGGLSLRKVNSFLNFIQDHKSLIDLNSHHKLYGIEDVFWSLVAPKYASFKIPDVKTAAGFSLDRKPKLGLKLNNFKLPFGCHGFEKKKTKHFWKNYIKGLE